MFINTAKAMAVMALTMVATAKAIVVMAITMVAMARGVMDITTVTKANLTQLNMVLRVQCNHLPGQKTTDDN